MFERKTLHHFVLAITALFFFIPSTHFLDGNNITALLAAVLIGTFFIYRLSVWVPIMNFKNPYLEFENTPAVYEFVFYSVSILCCYLLLNITTILLFSGWGLLSISYFTNIKIGAFQFKGLRSIPILKTIHLALLWTIIGFLFELNELSFNLPLIKVISIRFFIIFLICLGVDLRDIQKDLNAKTVTLATLIGFKNMKAIMLILNLTLIVFLSSNFLENKIEMLIAIILLLCTLYLKPHSKSATFTILLDGTLFLYSFLILIFDFTKNLT
jgi:hypothetical protein